MVRAPVPVFFSVAASALLAVPTNWLPKLRLEGVRDTPGAVPVPESATVCGPGSASSVKVSVPRNEPVAGGVNASATWQVAEGATEPDVEQVVLAGSTSKLTLGLMPVKTRLAPPVLVTVTA